MSMEYHFPDSSGTDDDFSQSHFYRAPIGSHFTENRRSAVNSAPLSRMHTDIESQIHHLELEAYGAVLRAFKAQSDALSWEKEGLITELRKELRVSDDEHRELLTRVNADDVICRIREWRKAGGNHTSFFNISQPVHDMLPSSTVSVPRKIQKTSQSGPRAFGAPMQAFHHHSISSTAQPAISAATWEPSLRAGGKKPKPGHQEPGLSTLKFTRYPSTGPTPRDMLSKDYGSSAILLANENAEAARHDPLIGRKVMTRWPPDNNFYEAVITDYNPDEDRHALVYERDTPNETWEWVDLKEVPAENIRWVAEDPDISHLCGLGKQGSGDGMSHEDFPSAGRGKCAMKNQLDEELPPFQNDTVKKLSDDIEILHTDTLIKEVEKVFGAINPNLLEIQNAKKMLKEHEQALINVISKLEDVYGGENDGEKPYQHEQTMEGEQGKRDVRYSGIRQDFFLEAEMREGRTDGPVMATVSLTSDKQQDHVINI